MDIPNTSEFIETLKSDKAAKAIGPYSVGKVVRPGASMIYLSG